MRLSIWKQAVKLVEQGKVDYIGSGMNNMCFIVADEVNVEIRTEENKTICTCKHHSINSIEHNLLCSYKLAVFLFIMTKKLVPEGSKTLNSGKKPYEEFF